VKYKREGTPCVDYKTIQEMVRNVVTEVVQKEIEDLKLVLYG